MAGSKTGQPPLKHTPVTGGTRVSAPIKPVNPPKRPTR